MELISSDEEQLEGMINELQEKYEDVHRKDKGYRIRNGNRQYSVDEHLVGKVDGYIYLEQQMNLGKQNKTSEITKRISLGSFQ